MPKSKWIIYQMDAKISGILHNVKSHDPRHHFGRPFMTAYQIAIEFERRYPKEFLALAKPVGGKGTRQNTSLTQYIANGLSSQIKKGKLPDVEGRFLCREGLKVLKYTNKFKSIEATNESTVDLSIYRWKT